MPSKQPQERHSSFLELTVDMAHRNIPIFIPHLGCPHQCVFCNQRSISGCAQFDAEQVDSIIQTALSTIDEKDRVEIAFFGGSFTGIDRDLMIRLLEMAERYVRAGRVESIRLSTRPDYISDEILTILSRYSVRHIELGLQSMQDAVLQASFRGHTAEQAMQACRAVVNAGFALTGQMMIGLPQSTPEDEIETARLICELGASSARIYPTVVFYHTPLAELCEKGSYQALSVEEAVLRSANALRVFEERGVPCIRIGLCATESLTSPKEVLAGPNHPALGELVWNEYYYRLICEKLALANLAGKEITVTVPRGRLSKVVGQHRSNLQKLLMESGTIVKKVTESLDATEVLVMPWCVS